MNVALLIGIIGQVFIQFGSCNLIHDIRKFVANEIFVRDEESCELVIRSGTKMIDNEFANLRNISMISLTTGVIKKQLSDFAQLVDEKMMCAIGIGFAEEWGKKADRYLKNMQHLTERVRDNLVVMVSRDLKGFEKAAEINFGRRRGRRVYGQVDRRFIFLHRVNDDIYSLHPFCPNCTLEEKKIPVPKIMWKRNQGVIGLRRKDALFNPFIDCCSVFKGTLFRVGYNGDPPHMMNIPRSLSDQKVRGLDISVVEEAFKHLGGRIRIKYEFFDTFCQYQNESQYCVYYKPKTWIGRIGSIMYGSIHIGVGNVHMIPRRNRLTDMSNYLFFDEWRFVAGYPKELPSGISNVTLPFPLEAWIVILASLFTFSFSFWLAYEIYLRIQGDEMQFVGHVSRKLDFLLLTFSGFGGGTSWFPFWSSGRLLGLLYSLFMMFIIFFYMCNLRALLATVRLERPIDGFHDIMYYGTSRKFYLPTDIGDFWPDEKSEQAWQGDQKRFGYWFQLVELVVATGGNYSLIDHRGLPPGAVEEIVGAKATTLHHRVSAGSPRPFHFLQHIFMRFATRNRIMSLPVGFQVKKNVPWAPVLFNKLDWMRDCGLIIRSLHLLAKNRILPIHEILPVQEEKPLQLVQIALAMIILPSGLFVANLVFLAEMIMKLRMMMRKRREAKLKKKVVKALKKGGRKRNKALQFVQEK